MADIDSTIEFWKNIAHKFIKECDAFLSIEKLKEFRRNYIPKYGQRNEEEHQQIRDNLRRKAQDCDHRKGGYFRSFNARTDYNISHHIFPNNVERVRCLVCGRKWFKGVAGWDPEVIEMLKHTSNSKTSSERPYIG